MRVNDRLAEVNGIPAAEHVGRRAAEVPSCGDSAATEALRRVLDRAQTVMGVELSGTVEGERRHYLKNFAPLNDASGSVVGASVSVEDVTRQKLSEEALLTASRIKDEFLGMVTHELRTPLTTILGVADMLNRRIEEMDSDSRSLAVSQLQEDAQRLHELIENMLLLSRAHQAPVEREPVLLQRLVPKVLAAAQRRHRNVRWESDLPDVLPPVTGQAGWVEQIILNLVGNSVKYTNGSAEVRVEASLEGERVELRVLDRGRGIQQEDGERIFEPFYRAPGTVREPGMGLGLAVCHRLANLMEGDISAKSRDGGGTVVTLCLPSAEQDDMAVASKLTAV